jgi:hypothetical protein
MNLGIGDLLPAAGAERGKPVPVRERTIGFSDEIGRRLDGRMPTRQRRSATDHRERVVPNVTGMIEHRLAGIRA